MSEVIISGIQQMGIGIPNVHEAFKWYRQTLDMDIKVFEEEAVAELMLPYTNNQTQARHAILALNAQGGGGLEIWQYTQRTPQAANFEVKLGDLGTLVNKFKCRDVAAAYKQMQEKGLDIQTPLEKDLLGYDHFYLKDPYGNLIEICHSDDWFRKTKSLYGGVYGAVIGVSDMEKSLAFYKNTLGYDTVLADETGSFNDFNTILKEEKSFRRVILTHSKKRAGSFSKMLGSSHIELISLEKGGGRQIFEGRQWGDLGYIHLCFDINGMDALREKCKNLDYPFTVDSASNMNSFDMGEAAGNFSYIEDPDKNLIEFVETHKVPIVKKWGWYLDLRNRDARKALPNWMLKAMALNRVKD